MSTSIVLANGSLLINIDYDLKVTDLYYPNIGSENQLNRFSNSLFFSYENKLIELNEKNFEIEVGYKPNSNIGLSNIKSKDYAFNVSFEEYVLKDRNIYIREIEIKDATSLKNKFKIFFTQNFALGESIFADTVYYNPLLDCMIHYKKNRYLAFGFVDDDFEFSCAAKSDNNGKGAIPNKESKLDKNLIATGNVNSVISTNVHSKGKDTFKSKYFIIAGKSLKEIEKELIFLKTKISNKDKVELKSIPKTNLLNALQDYLPKYFTVEESEKIISQYFKSIDIIKTQIDSNGAIIASNDGQYLKVDGTDSYSYVWPRDASEVVKTLIDVDEKKLAKNSLDFLLDLIDKRGFFWHKYYPQATNFNSSVASSWQPWLSKNNNMILPIQEDGTALFLQAFEKYFSKYNDIEYLFKNWKNKIKPVIEFLLDFRFKDYGLNDFYSKFINDFPQFQKTGISLPSFDIWEQYYGIFTYTVTQVLCAYESAIKLALVYEDVEILERIKVAKDELYKALISKLLDNSTGSFFKGIHLEETKVILNTEADSSLVYLWKSGVFDIIDSKVTATMSDLIDKLYIKNHIGGISRKENDHYLKISDYNNPWVLSTLWISQYYFKINDISKAKALLLWVLTHADKTGLLGEQVNPLTGFSLSVKPLTWSHAEFVNTVNMISSLN